MAGEFQLSRDPGGELRFRAAAGGSVTVVPTLAFPLSDPERWISLRTPAGEEVAFLEDPAELPEPIRTLLQEELRRVHFVPRVTRIHRVTSGMKGFTVQLDSDRGPVTIELDDDESTRRISETCVALMDVRGIRYLIPDISALDRHSRHCLERFL